MNAEFLNHQQYDWKTKKGQCHTLPEVQPAREYPEKNAINSDFQDDPFASFLLFFFLMAKNFRGKKLAVFNPSQPTGFNGFNGFNFQACQLNGFNGFKGFQPNPQEHQEPEAWTKVPVMAQGAKALEVPVDVVGCWMLVGEGMFSGGEERFFMF